ncbi:4'-phosphopantetheinyl transferase family protein [Thalassovita sp.]|uniref:4'-phosphopantetheinyl transferase family protein n=1 Tax=Thalassovita sp. TaxID=1979401 RepID=UPI002881EB90|nr:4'-phosphopantetheinyl transferase superfamily protein [Thalassovita sp.]MDF1802040.1 4'-phosphopantetheinyl transferase superfamily protein [Thalassovita sp.]
MTPARVAALFDCPVGVGVTDPRRPSGSLFPEEETALGAVVPKRRNEFIAGRTAARQALSALGGPIVALPPGKDRLPHWPRGYAGSITHCDDLCLAAVTRAARSIGLDVEPATPLPVELVDEILLPDERRIVAASSRPDVMAKAVFSMKEAAYKAQYPLSSVMYGFHDMALHWDVSGHFEAEFLITAGTFQPHDRISGRFMIDSGHIVATAFLA